MKPDARIHVAGHRGLVGSALVRRLQTAGFSNLLLRSSSELDLRDAQATDRFYKEQRPEYVFIAAAKVGGILANDRYPVEFLTENLSIQNSLINASYRHGVSRLLFLGSSCIYPKDAPQPLQESHLMTGPLEPTNRAYAIAKIAGVELCWSYNRQYRTQYLGAMPTNLFGRGDNYHPDNSHVIPALICKFHRAKVRGEPAVSVWGSGTPRREFLYSDNLADACMFLMNLDDAAFTGLISEAPLVNIGAGSDVSIAELASMVKATTGFTGDIVFDRTKPDGTPRKLLDSSRINALGWQASISLSQGLALAYDDFQEA